MAGAAITASITALALTAVGDRATVHVAPLATRLTAGTEIGRRGVGWTCFPAGTVHWRDLSFDPNEAARAVALSLTQQGVPADVLTADEARSRGGHILSGTIRAVSVKACAPQYGIGRLLGGAPKARGQVTITIGWILRGASDDAVSEEFLTRRDIKVSAREAGDEIFLATALADASREAAEALKPTISLPRRSPPDGDRR